MSTYDFRKQGRSERTIRIFTFVKSWKTIGIIGFDTLGHVLKKVRYCRSRRW